MERKNTYLQVALDMVERGFIIIKYAGEPEASLVRFSDKLATMDIEKEDRRFNIMPLRLQLREFLMSSDDVYTNAFLDSHMGNTRITSYFQCSLGAAPKENTPLIDRQRGLYHIPVLLTYSPTNLGEVNITEPSTLQIILMPSNNTENKLWVDLISRRQGPIKQLDELLEE